MAAFVFNPYMGSFEFKPSNTLDIDRFDPLTARVYPFKQIKTSLPYTLTQYAGAAISPSSATNYFYGPQGSGPDLSVLGTTIGVCWYEPTKASSDKCLWGVCRSGRGWWIDNPGSIGNLALMLPGGTPATIFLYSGLTYSRPGLNCMFITHMLDGSIWRAINGSAGTRAHTGPTIIPVDATCDHLIGRCSPAIAAYPNTDSGIVWIVHIAAEASATQLQEWSDVVNLTERWTPLDAVSLHASLVSETRVVRDWNGSATTMVSGLGSAPVTFTRQGSLSRVELLREKIYLEAQALWHQNSYYVAEGAGETAHNRVSDAAILRIITDATTLAIDGVSDFSSASTTWQQIGVWDRTTRMVVQQYLNANRECLHANLPAGSKTVDIWTGLQTKPSTVVRGQWIRSIRVPMTANLQFVQPSNNARKLTIYGDSITVGDSASNTATEGYALIIGRGGTYPGDTQLEAWGYRSLYDDCNTEALRIAFAQLVAGQFSGVTTPEILVAIGTNDYGLPRCSASDFQAWGGDWIDRLKVLVPALTVWWMGILLRSEEGVPNSYGNTPADYRTAAQNIVTPRNVWCHYLHGPDLLPGLAALHPNTAQHATLAANLKIGMGF